MIHYGFRLFRSYLIDHDNRWLFQITTNHHNKMSAINLSNVWDVGVRINTIALDYIHWVTEKRLLMQTMSMLQFLNKVDAILRPSAEKLLTVSLVGPSMYMSIARCRKLRTKVPLGPLIVTTRAFTLHSTPSGMSIDCFAFKIFIFYLKSWKVTW